MARILVTLALAAYNNVANRWAPFNRAAYVPANVVAAAALLVVASGPLDLTPHMLGIAGATIGDASIGLGIGAAIGGIVLALARLRPRLVADRRVSGLRGRTLAYQTLIRVPFGTALLEELAFRGVLFAAWRTEGELVACAVSSVVFGLWHVVPAATMVRVNAPGASRATLVRAVAGTVVLTSLLGAVLVWLRLATGSLAAPFAAHAAVNSLATYAGAWAGRRLSG